MIDENALQPTMNTLHGRGEATKCPSGIHQENAHDADVVHTAEAFIRAWNEQTNWEELLILFRSQFDYSDTSMLDRLPSALPNTLITLLQNYQHLSVTALINVMAVVYDWLKQQHSTIVKFFVPEVISSSCDLACADGNGNERVLLLALMLIRFLCSREQNEVLGFHQYVLESRKDVVRKLVFYGSEQNRNNSIKKEALCTIWAILRNKPSSLLIRDFEPLFSSIATKFESESFDFLLATAAVFVTCGGSPRVLFPDPSDVALLFEVFPKLTCIVRSRILYLVMILFECGGEIVEVLAHAFNWALVCECVARQGDDEEVFNFLRLASVAFASTDVTANLACDAGVMPFLFGIARSQASFTQKRYAMLALLSAFQYGSLAVCEYLLSQGILRDMSEFLENECSGAITFRIFLCMPKFVMVIEGKGETQIAEEIRDIVEAEFAGNVTEDMVPVEISEESVSYLCATLKSICEGA